MKKLIVILLVTILALSGQIYAGGKVVKDAPVAIIMKVIKDVSIKKGAGNWIPAKMGLPLSTTDEIKTGDKSLALIKFTDNSILRVRENSTLKIFADKNNGALSKNTYIDQGKVGFHVTKQQDEEFKFTTPTMVASIRGTGGELQVFSDSTLLILGEGIVDILARKGSGGTGTVHAGEHMTVDSQGNIVLYTNTDKEKNELGNSEKSNIKRLVIKTNRGDLIIEYLSSN
jgi:hypothetical protein